MATGLIPKLMDGADGGWKNTGLKFAFSRDKRDDESQEEYDINGRFILYYRIIGNLCAISGEVRLENDLATGNGFTFNQTIPEEARPKTKRAFFPANCLAGYGFFVISSNGSVQLQNRSGNTYVGGQSGSRLFVASLYVLN